MPALARRGALRLLVAAAALLLPFSLAACLSAPDRAALAADYLYLADCYAEVEEYEKALFFYEKASKEDAFKDIATYGMGRMHALSENWAAAIKVFKALYEKEPENSILLSAYAFALASDGQLDKALPLYSKLKDERPDDARVAADYVELLFAAKMYDEARAEAAAVKEKFPDNEQTVSLDNLEERIEKALKGEDEGPKDGKEGDAGNGPPPHEGGEGAPR